MIKDDIIIADTDLKVANLAKLIASLGQRECISLDTEFWRQVTYYPRICLMQLKVRDFIYIVDPFAADIVPVVKALFDTKASILAFCGYEDYECLLYEAQKAGLKISQPVILDMQLLCSFCGLFHGRSLQHCLKEVLNLEISKEQTLSNWQQRPLADEQIEYAAADVRYLEELLDALKPKLESNLWDGFVEECAIKTAEVADSPSNPQFHRKFSTSRKLNQKQLTIFAFLLKRRLSYAMAEDIPPARIFSTASAAELAIRLPASRQALSAAGLKPRQIRQSGDLLAGWIKEAKNLPEDPSLKPAYDAVCTMPYYRPFAEYIKNTLEAISLKHKICPEILVNKKLLNYTLSGLIEGQEQGLLEGWKKQLCQELKPHLEAFVQGRVNREYLNRPG